MSVALIGFGDLGRRIEDALDEFHQVDKSKTAYFDDPFMRPARPTRFFSASTQTMHSATTTSTSASAICT